jgi:hypothetical protein
MRKLFIAFVLVCAAALAAVSFTRAAAPSPCTDQCYSDYQIARNACMQSPNPIQCLAAAKAARDQCLAGCQ